MDSATFCTTVVGPLQLCRSLHQWTRPWKVLNVLLQLLDDGRITDSQGRTVDCSRSAKKKLITCGEMPRKTEFSKGERDEGRKLI